MTVYQIFTGVNPGGAEVVMFNHMRLMPKKYHFVVLVERKDTSFFDSMLCDNIEIVVIGSYCSLRYIRNLVKLFYFSRDAIVHSHVNVKSIIPLFIAKLFGVKTRILHSHINLRPINLSKLVSSVGFYEEFKVLIKTILVPYAKHMSTINLACGVDAGRWMFSDTKFNVFRNAIEFNKFRFDLDNRNRYRLELGLGNDDLLIGHVGRFYEQKNHTFMIDIAKRMLDNGVNFKMIFIGSGDLIQSVNERIALLGLSDNVIMYGVTNNTGDILSAMDLFLFPSLYEGLPLTLIEAQVNDLPVLASSNVTDEVAMTNLVTRMSLELGVDDWIETIGQILKRNRGSRGSLELPDSSPYNIYSNCEELSKIYEIK